MNIPEEFGGYLLLKKLAEDPLGETFRAGKAGKGGLEQVVLLRVFNGKGIDGEKLWHKAEGRAAVQQALRSPNIGSGVDLGRVRNYPYVAYDYISGKNLAALLEKSSGQMSPLPTDHALLIAERIALALTAAYETRLQDERVLHGLVVPHLVMISNEGETRLLGFEVAAGLREALAAGVAGPAGLRAPELAPYLAPEAVTGAPVAKADDVWSLGALLFELLTGEPLPAPGSEGHRAAIQGAVLAYDGTPLPPAVAALLEKSLVPRAERMADAATWHKALSKLMSEGHYSPTTFNLAFFMHNLFRDEIERESQEIQAERKIALPERPAAVAPAATMAMPAAHAATRPPAAPAADMREKTGVREITLAGARAQAAAEPAAGRKGLVLGIAAAAAVVLGVGGYFVLGRSPEKPAAPPPAPAAQPAPPLGTEALLPAGTDPALAAPEQADLQQVELEAQITAMFDARSKEMEDKLRGQYDQKIKDLQKQLEESRRAAAEPPAAPAVHRPEPTAPAPSPELKMAANNPPLVPPAPAAEEAKPPAPALQPATGQAPAGGSAAVPAPVRPSAPPAAPKPAVRVGDLVTAGPGVARPQLVSLPDPRYPTAARRMNRAAQVDVKVLVDENGNVAQAERIGAKVGFGFDEAALEAARRARFRPANKENVRVKMWTTLRVSFTP